MKKSVYSVIVFLFFALTANAGGLLSVGVKAGANFPNQRIKSGGDKVETSSLVGFNGGLMAGVRVPLLGMGVQAELLYSQKGSKFDGDLKNKFDYIDLPIYLRWSFNLPVVRPYLGVGPYWGFPVSTKIDGEDNDDFKRTDFGIAAILGVELFDKLQVGLNYQYGTRNVYDGPGDDKVKNTNFAISLGYLIF